MAFGTAETMGVHEILTEKICMLDHFSLYASQCQDPVLRQMIQRHVQTGIDSYNQLVSYTHDYQTARPMMAGMNIDPQSIQYGLRNPSQQAPVMQAGKLNDMQIATAVLLAHKNSARNHMTIALECADPNIRQMMMNGSVTCCNQSYEVFIYMNQRGIYQVPTMSDHTAKTYLHTYQPVPQTGMGMQTSGMGTMPMNQQPMPGQAMSSPSSNMGQASRQTQYQGNPYLM